MLYVTAGLAVMFGVLALLGLGAIDRASDLVFQERLATAYTTGGILEGDLARTGGDVREAARQWLAAGNGPVPVGSALQLLQHFDRVGPYSFFRVSGIWLLDQGGALQDQAGSPTWAGSADAGRGLAAQVGTDFAVLRALGPVPGQVAFAAVAVRLGGPSGQGGLAIVHTVSVNSPSDYVPADHGRAGSASGAHPSAEAATGAYHLEIIDPDGVAVLGVGADERPGQLSPHFRAIQALMGQHAAATLVHEPAPGGHVEPHVMAVVPLSSGPYYLVLEQAVDVALALPLELRQRLIFSIAGGFIAALVLAWVTTRRVVKPTEQLTAAAERMSGGDLASPIAVTAQDEIGKLAEALDTMRQRLRDAYDDAERQNRQLEERVAERTVRLRQFLGQTIDAQEEERRRLSRELHDETAQTLAALGIALDRARDELQGASPSALRQILEAKEIATRLLAETRRLILGLRPSLLDDMGLLAAIRWYAESYLGDQGVVVTVVADQSPQRLPGHIELTLFRIAQETITNIAKHAQATRVQISLAFTDRTVTVTVADDGRGFDVERALARRGASPESLGLMGMQERVRLLNGRMEIRSGEGGGTMVVIEAPVSDEPA